MHKLQKVKKLIEKSKSIVIASHINPDGDSIGSLLSLGLALKSLGKKVYFLSQDGVPIRYRFLPGAKLIKKSLQKSCNLAISVDCSNKEILGSAYETFKKAKKILAIDHHEFRRPFSHVSLVDKNAAAVGEIIYQLINYLNIKITRNIATNILTSIIVETNSFRLPNVEASTFDICGKLLQKGVNFYRLVDKVYWSQTRNSAILSGICLSRAQFIKSGGLVWSIIKQVDLNRVKGKDEDVDAVADQMRAIDGTKVIVLFRQKDHKHIRVSLRSKDRINVASVAERYGGGGHFDVAGCYIPNTNSAINNLLKSASQLIK